VNGLTQLLQRAAAMSEEDYRELATAAHQSLAGELVKPDFYADTYRTLTLK
jgi:hypothetical protein